MKKFKLAILLCIIAGSLLHAQMIETIAGGGTTAITGNGSVNATDANLIINDTITYNTHNNVTIILDKMKNTYICQSYENRILKMDAQTKQISIVAGTGVSGYSADGILATAASLEEPSAIALDTAGNLYIGEYGYSGRIRRVDSKTGIISTIMGAGPIGLWQVAGDTTHAIYLSSFNDHIESMIFDKNNNLYIGQYGGLLKIDASTGIIHFGPPNGPVAIYGMAADTAGNIYLADGGCSIGKIDAITGNYTTLAGQAATRKIGFSGDGGPAAAAYLNEPTSIACDASGNLYFADSQNNRIRRIDGTTGIITTYAGTGDKGFYGDGRLATKAHIDGPRSIVTDAQGNLYIADTVNYRIRVVYADSTKESYNCNGFAVSISGTTQVLGCTGTLTATVSAGTFPYTYKWLYKGSTATISNLCPGQYDLIVIDSIGCGAVDSLIISSKQPLSAAITTTNCTSADSCNGSVAIYPSGGVPPYQVRCSDLKQTTQFGSPDFSLCPNFYYAIVTDAIGNKDSLTFVIASPNTSFNQTNYADSAVVNTLSTNPINDCSINFGNVDSVSFLTYTFTSSDSIQAIWRIKQKGTPPAFNYVTTKYQIGISGWYTLQLYLYCDTATANANAGTANVLEASQQVYISNMELGIAAVNGNKTQGATSVYPIPFSDNLNINFASADTHYITVYDILGNQVNNRTQVNGTTNTVLNLNALANGIYMVKVETNNNVEFIKTIKN